MTNISNSRILVTGGSGLVGSHTVDRLINEDVEKIIVFDKFINVKNIAEIKNHRKIEIIEGDITNQKLIGSILLGVDFVFHFAGMLLLSAAENPRECLINNINGMYDFLEMFIKHNVQKLIYSSSISIYGSSKKKILMDENYPLNNRTMYGASKIIAEQFCRVLNETDGLNYLALRYSSVYGPRQHYEGLYPRLIMKSLDRIDNDLNPQIQGKGNEVQNFIYAEDVAEANILALKSNIGDEAINIVSETITTTKKLIQTLIDLTKPELEIEYIPRSDKKFVPYRWFSGKKAMELLGFKAQTELKDGLEKLIEWKNKI